jgi:hypothetical protein
VAMVRASWVEEATLALSDRHVIEEHDTVNGEPMEFLVSPCGIFPHSPCDFDYVLTMAHRIPI